MSSSAILVVYAQSRGGIVFFSSICFQSFKIHHLAKLDPLDTRHLPEKSHYNNSLKLVDTEWNRFMNNTRDIVGLSFFDPNNR